MKCEETRNTDCTRHTTDDAYKVETEPGDNENETCRQIKDH
jgi:hypothetical protein